MEVSVRPWPYICPKPRKMGHSLRSLAERSERPRVASRGGRKRGLIAIPGHEC